MLRHLNNAPTLPERTVVIGAAGFVGGALMRRLAAANAPALGLTRKEVDLQRPNATNSWPPFFNPATRWWPWLPALPVKHRHDDREHDHRQSHP